jgi:hypothetical protein
MSGDAIRVLLQTTIPMTDDDWSIARFSRLGTLLRDQRDAHGHPVFDVTMRNRDPLGAPDSVLASLDRSRFDEMWLFAVDEGEGLTEEDCQAIAQFRDGIVTLTSVGRADATSGHVGLITQPVERMFPAARC